MSTDLLASARAAMSLAKKHGADSGFVYGPAPTSKEESKALADGFKAACGGCTPSPRKLMADSAITISAIRVVPSTISGPRMLGMT